jgi:hypothetical protein
MTDRARSPFGQAALPRGSRWATWVLRGSGI